MDLWVNLPKNRQTAPRLQKNTMAHDIPKLLLWPMKALQKDKQDPDTRLGKLWRGGDDYERLKTWTWREDVRREKTEQLVQTEQLESWGLVK